MPPMPEIEGFDDHLNFEGNLDPMMPMDIVPVQNNTDFLNETENVT